ncbi:MAG: hypothetical protein JW896_01495 [Deltaproteobacteria bacterium]|nr:hypothetical protein [Deltaproteobacteria bacterium]
MNAFYILIIRITLSMALSWFICRLFFHGTSIIRVLGLAVIMLILSYLFENMRKNERKE